MARTIMDITAKLHVMAGVRKALPDEESGGFPREYIPVIEEAAYLIERQRAVLKAIADHDNWGCYDESGCRKGKYPADTWVGCSHPVEMIRALDGGGDE